MTTPNASGTTTRWRTRRGRAIAGVLGFVLVAGALAGCSSSAGEAAGTGPASSQSASNDPVTLDFWTWTLKGADPRAQAIVDRYHQEHPNVTIKLSEVGGTAETSAKLLAADRADDAPDIVQVEYRGVPSLVVAGAVKDITADAAPIQDAYDPNVRSLATLNDQVYGIPQDIGPMMLTYRSDRFAELGVKVPTTWAEYAQAAEQIHAKDPSSYIASFSASEFDFFAMQAAQAGANWWQTNGDAWSVGIDGPESNSTANFWQDLVDRDLVKVEPLLTPEWNAQVNAGKILSWAAAAWAPSVIYAVAPDTAGKWQSAPLPQWTPGNSAVPFLGGSAYLIPEKSQHAQAAVEFASWLAASKEGSELLLGLDIYPASNAGQEATLNHAPPQLMPEQTDFYKIADQVITDTTIPVTWGPNVNVAQSAFSDTLSAAALNKTSFSDVYTLTQNTVVDDLTKSGYQVSE